MNQPKVLVTGATGFLGRHLLRTLAEQGVGRVALVREASAWEAQPWRHEVGDVSLVQGSPLDSERWKNDPALAGVTTIFHTAGIVSHSRKSPEAMLELNVDGTLGMVH